MGILYGTKAENAAEVRLLISEKNWLETTAVDQLKQTATLDNMRLCVGMPDLHPGKGQPIGAAFISESMVYPHLVGSDIGCGMGLWQLDVKARSIKLDKWEKKLQGLDDGLSQEQLINLLGPQKVQGLPVYRDKLGTIGGGNHFAEFQCVHQIADAEVFSKLGLDAKAVFLLVHSGSRGMGQDILQRYIQEFGTSGLSSSSEAADKYLGEHDQALQWAALNRQAIAKRFVRCLGLGASEILDKHHNMVLPLGPSQVTSLGLNPEKDYWIHRKGACPSDAGLVVVPGSRGSLSYLLKPKVENAQALAQTGFSLAHGAGRKWKRGDAKARLAKRYNYRDLQRTSFNSRVICESRELIFEEAPQAYKNIDQVVADLIQAGVADVVASFAPVLSYKTRRKR